MTRAARFLSSFACGELVPCALALLVGACATEASDGAGSSSGAPAANASGAGGSSNQPTQATAGSQATAAGGASSAHSGAGGTATMTGGSGSSGGVAAGGSSGGAASGGAASGGAAGAPPVSAGPGTTPDLIGPGGPTCGNPNATHDDGWICLLSAPAPGTNFVGAWFDYAWPAATSCTHKLTKPAGASRAVCFSGGACAAAAAGAGIGFSVCDVHGVNVSTWPEMQALITSHGLSTTGKSPFSACNTGAKITQVNWTASGAGTPAGMSVVFQDAADAAVGRVDNLAAGATSAMVPAGLDTSKVASVHFQFGGAVKSWDFCLSKVTLSYQ